MPRRTLLVVAGLFLSLASSLALAACGDDGDGDAAAPSRPDCASPSGVSQDDWFTHCAPGGTPAAGPANTAPVGGWVAMPNGVAVSVARVEPAPVETTQPGFTPALITLTVSNRSTTPYDVSGVDIREMGRVDGTRAERITHSQLPQQDLTGTLAPGQATMAQQLFNVPDTLRPGFRIVVAMTPLPSALPDATFTGTLPAPSATATATTPTAANG
jgi:hypothetical protein